MLGNDSAECLYGTMMLNKVDRIFHKDMLDVESEFGENRTKSQNIMMDFTYKKSQNTHPAELNLTLMSECIVEFFGTKWTESRRRVFLMM